MRTDLLNLLADKLALLPQERFDYNVWIGNDWAGHQDLSCGTTACALGWAATIPEIREAGLHINKIGFGTYVLFRDEKDGWGQPIEGVSAAQRAFDLSLEEARYLFLPTDKEYGVTPSYVAEKIRNFIVNGLPPRFDEEEEEENVDYDSDDPCDCYECQGNDDER